MLAEQAAPGFVFSNVQRNELLTKKIGISNGAKSNSNGTVPKALKTGTTIAGCIFDNGVVLAADTRATGGSIVMDKNCSKVHYIADNMYCCGAGTAADTEMVTRQISAQINLHRMATGRQPRVVTAKQLVKDYLFRYQGYIGAALIMGGTDSTGPHLYSISPNGYVDANPFATMGSGSLAAMAVLEAGFKDNMSQQKAVQLCRDAIAAGIFNDLGSGSNIDICIIKRDKTDFIRPYEVANEKGQRSVIYNPGSVAQLRLPELRPVLADIVSTRIIRDADTGRGEEAPMET